VVSFLFSLSDSSALIPLKVMEMGKLTLPVVKYFLVSISSSKLMRTCAFFVTVLLEAIVDDDLSEKGEEKDKNIFNNIYYCFQNIEKSIHLVRSG